MYRLTTGTGVKDEYPVLQLAIGRGYSVKFEAGDEEEVSWLILFAEAAAQIMRGTPLIVVKRLGVTLSIELLLGIGAVQAHYSTTQSQILIQEIDEEFRNQIVAVSDGAFDPKADSF